MHKNFFTLEAQAIRAKLAGILPPKMHTPWSKKSCHLFFELVESKQIVAQIAGINYEVSITINKLNDYFRKMFSVKCEC